MKKIIKKLKKILKIRKKKEKNIIYNKLDFKKIINIPIKNINRIIFVIPNMVKYSGGHTSILRLGTQLSQKYEVKYASYIENEITLMKEAASSNLKNYKGEILNLSNLETTVNDIIIATFWESVYYIKSLKGYKMYFIQDYEPYFYAYGEKFILAAKTYEMGLHMVSLGQWNLEKIKEQLKAIDNKMNYIDFPYEKKEYFNIKRNYDSYKNKKEIKLCAYVKKDDKRIPFVIEKILLNLREKLKLEQIELKVYYFGNGKSLELEGGINLGKLSKEELNKLYCECDFGICASITNISLVPYEMLATGLPLIEFKEGSFEYFFKDESAILTDFSGDNLKDKILESLNHTEILKQRNENARRILKKLSWENSGKQFLEIIDNIENFDILIK